MLGLINPPAALAIKLMSEVLTPVVETDKAPVKILDPLIPLVVSKVILAEEPLVLFAITIVPVD